MKIGCYDTQFRLQTEGRRTSAMRLGTKLKTHLTEYVEANRVGTSKTTKGEPRLVLGVMAILQRFRNPTNMPISPDALGLDRTTPTKAAQNRISFKGPAAVVRRRGRRGHACKVCAFAR